MLNGLCLLLLWSCKTQESPLPPATTVDKGVYDPMEVVQVSVWSPVYPVLIGKENNPVLRVLLEDKSAWDIVTFEAGSRPKPGVSGMFEPVWT